MPKQSIILIGGPDSGKTNYLARLWEDLRGGEGKLVAPEVPPDITYVEDALRHLLQGQFAPRSDKGSEELVVGLSIPVVSAGQRDDERGVHTEIAVPDVSGELWRQGIHKCKLPSQWMETVKSSFGALLFVRIGSKQNKEPLDWVTAASILKHAPNLADSDRPTSELLPTGVQLCEYLRLLEHSLSRDTASPRPRVAVLVTAWDRLDPAADKLGPNCYLAKEYPLFSGRLEDIDTIDVKVFGVSVVGGDFVEEEFRTAFFNADLRKTGYVVHHVEDKVEKEFDLTLPVAWLLESLHNHRS